VNPQRLRRSLAVTAAVGLLALALAPAASGAGPGPGPGPLRPIGALLPPIAVDDSMTVKHDRTRTVAAPGVLANDVQIGSGYTAVLTTDATHGDLDLDSDGGYTYSPDSGYVGADSFRYKVDGGLLGLSNIATVSITVTNVAPVANPNSYSAVADVEKTVGAPGLLANDDDADGDALVVDVVEEPANGNLNEDDDGSFRYKADDGFEGTDTFTYRVFDGVAWSNTTTVTMTVSLAEPTPTPTPTATPTPKPTASPTPTPTPILPLPTLPLPTLIPTATPQVTPTPTPTATASPTAGPTASPSATPGPSVSPSPGATTAPTFTPAPGAIATRSPGPSTGNSPTATPGTDATDAPGAGGAGTGAGPGGGTGTPPDRFVLPVLEPPGIDAVIDATFTGLAGVEWAVPAFALTVPGLLLMAIGAQALVGVAWLPVVRRWLGGVGVRRRTNRRDRLRT
jgi:hypothetical protein